MGLLAFLVLMSVEVGLGVVLGPSLGDQLAAFKLSRGAIGLGTHVIFAMFPVFRAGGGRPRSEKDAAAALCERLDPLPGEVDNSYRLAFTQQRNAKPGTHLANCDYLRQSVFWIGGKIGNLDRLPRKQSPPRDAAATGLESQTPHGGIPFGRKGES
jgi:hypothetical protein